MCTYICIVKLNFKLYNQKECMAVFIICLCMLACVVLVELEVHLIHVD